ELTSLYSGWDGRKQFEGTGERLRRMSEECFWNPSVVELELEKCFKSFEEAYSEMLVEGPISVWTFCPHHLLPCHFDVHIGYIPNGRVLGLSKFSRISEILAKRPVMQEQYTREVANCIEKHLKPEGVGVYVIGKHGCMRCRGVKQEETSVKTATLRGSFMEDPSVRYEFYQIVKGGN
ncbi:GTP cyclohydrolase I, partial [Patescibacteria group bacterium]|nr:GTP cyclohydrolase I [Patescibacteria group bacterium]